MSGLRRILTATAAVATMAIAMPVRAETLSDALVDAYRNSNLLEQNRALLAAADEDVAQAVSRLRPVISFAANYLNRRTLLDNSPTSAVVGRRSTVEQTTLDLALEMVLYDFGRTRTSIDLAKETVLATRAALLSVEQQVLLEAVRAYVLHDGVLVPLGDAWQIVPANTSYSRLSLVRDLPVTLDDGTESTFGPGTILQVTGTDGKSFVDVITEDGVTGRIAITQPAGDWQWYINGEPELEYFELVPYAG